MKQNAFELSLSLRALLDQTPLEGILNMADTVTWAAIPLPSYFPFHDLSTFQPLQCRRRSLWPS